MLTFRRVSFSVLCWSILSSKWSPFGAPFWHHFDHFGRTFFNMFPDTLKASKRVPKRYPKWSLLGSFFGVCSERARHRFLMTPPMKIHDFRGGSLSKSTRKRTQNGAPQKVPKKGAKIVEKGLSWGPCGLHFASRKASRKTAPKRAPFNHYF